MRLRNTLNGYEYEAQLTAETSASSYGHVMLVDIDSGAAIDQFSAALTEIVEATPAERSMLQAAGYMLR